MLCKNCGREFYESNNKCPFCNAEIKEDEFKKSTSLEGETVPVKKSSKKIHTFSLFLLLFVFSFAEKIEKF